MIATSSSNCNYLYFCGALDFAGHLRACFFVVVVFLSVLCTQQPSGENKVIVLILQIRKWNKETLNLIKVHKEDIRSYSSNPIYMGSQFVKGNFMRPRGIELLGCSPEIRVGTI